MTTPRVSIEVITLPVSDVNRRCGSIRIRSASCLTLIIQIGNGLTDAPAGSVRNIDLVVTDLDNTRARLLECGVEVSEVRHKTPIGLWGGGFAPGLDAARRDCASFANFSDLHGNSWVLQEPGFRNV